MSREFNVGDRVLVTEKAAGFSVLQAGAIGTVVRVLDDDDFDDGCSVGVLFDNWHHGHDLGFLKGDESDRGYWLFDEALDEDRLQIISPKDETELEEVKDLHGFYFKRRRSLRKNH